LSQQHPFEYRSRIDRRRARAMMRRHRRRRTGASVAVILLFLCIGVGAWLGYKVVSGRRKPAVPRTFKVVIPEGLTVDQTAVKVENQTSITAEQYRKAVASGGYDYGFLDGSNGNLEGFLFPKTYQVTDKTPARRLIGMQLDQFQKETSGLDWARAGSLGITPYQAVIVASMVEKEAKMSDERPVIASVVYNRLKAGMKLQICSTVQYALGRWKPSLSYKDLEVDSPYNTYKISGLPPAPICSPGFESIRAALYPEATGYLYFILTSPGRHSFTADYQQFLRWKQEQAQPGG